MSLDNLSELLHKKIYTWMITGVAGFIGSNILEFLLQQNQKVIGIDNFVNGNKNNIEDALSSVTSKQKMNFIFYEIDICEQSKLDKLKVNKIDFILHQAALGSVPKSIKFPLEFNKTNVNGFLNILNFANKNKIKKVIYASSSSVYGNNNSKIKEEDNVGDCLSPYALTKKINELYALNFFNVYGLSSIGLRYFNVFGPRQNPEGEYAAVIPKWISCILNNKNFFIYGDGRTSRDFTYVSNVIQANILAALTKNKINENKIYNVGVGETISLNKLSLNLFHAFDSLNFSIKSKKNYKPFRKGDIKYSRASINNIKSELGFFPNNNFKLNLEKTIKWYLKKQK